jgi:hypothetical protein
VSSFFTHATISIEPGYQNALLRQNLMSRHGAPRWQLGAAVIHPFETVGRSSADMSLWSAPL